jgi:cytosine/adenosine deaminase-related metal-dependent hydrolase
MVPEQEIESLVTGASAALLRLTNRGALREGMLADIVILPRAMPLWNARRADLRGVMLGGNLLYGDAAIASQLLRNDDRAGIVVDGSDKVLRRDIADQLQRYAAGELGVQWMRETGRAA